MTVERNDAQAWDEEDLEIIAHYLRHDCEGSFDCATSNLLEMDAKHVIPFLVMKRTLELCPGVSLRLSPNLQVALIAISDDVQDISLMVIDCLEMQSTLQLPRTERLRCDDIFFRVYPYGFYSAEAKERRLQRMLDRAGDILSVIRAFEEVDT